MYYYIPIQLATKKFLFYLLKEHQYNLFSFKTSQLSIKNI